MTKVENVYHSDGTMSETLWACCGKESETDSQGVHRSFTYDGLQRVAEEIREGTATQSDITTYTYDPAGRRIGESVSSNGLLVSTSSAYDPAGRLTTSTDQAGLVSRYGYDPAGLISTVTRPGNSTEITERYRDGRIKSITGSGVIPQYYQYGVNPDGSQWSMVVTGSSNAPRWEKTTTCEHYW